MSSYTAQLFESLRRAASPDAAASQARQLNFSSFTLPPPDAPHLGVERGLPPAASSSVGTGSLLSPVAVSKPSSFSPTSGDSLPGNLEECHAILQYQRTQLAQLRSRNAALEDQIAQLRDRAASSGDTGSGAVAASRQHGEELAALRSTIEAQTSEITKLRDERTGLMKRVMEQQKKLDDARAEAEREKQELAYKLGKETAMVALGASQTLSSGAAQTVPTSPFRLTDAPAAPSTVRRGAGLRVAQEKETKDEPAAESSAAALLRELNIESKTAEAPHAADAGNKEGGPSDVSASLDTTTTSLLAKQEQLKQQELLLQALKQQQVQNRVLSAQAQRLQHQVQAVHSSPRGSTGPGFSPMHRFGGAPHTPGFHGAGQFGYPGPAPAFSPSRTSYHPTGGASHHYGGGYAPPHGGHNPRSHGPSHGYSGSSFGAPPPQYSAPPPPMPYGSPYESRRRLSSRGYGQSQEGGEYGVSDMPSDGIPPMLPPPGSPVSQGVAFYPPAGGWTVYMHPPEGTKWPETMAFFRPLVDTGIPVIKHGRMGRPHKRLMWLDITEPAQPVLVWQEGEQRNPGKIKEKDRLPLIEIEDIKAGQVSAILQRSGNRMDADKYMSFTGESRTLDIELPTPEGRDWMFKKFADLFQAYATAQREKLQGDDVTLRVADIMDGGADISGAGPYPEEPEPEMMMPPPPHRSRGRSPGPDHGYYGPPSYGPYGGR